MNKQKNITAATYTLKTNSKSHSSKQYILYPNLTPKIKIKNCFLKSLFYICFGKKKKIHSPFYVWDSL